MNATNIAPTAGDTKGVRIGERSYEVIALSVRQAAADTLCHCEVQNAQVDKMSTNPIMTTWQSERLSK